jgi:hypothetical protein
LFAALSINTLAQQLDPFNQAVSLFKRGDHAEAAKQFAALAAT